MKICIIGSNGHYHYALDGLDRGMRVTAIAPGCPHEDMEQVRQSVARTNDVPKFYHNYREMLEHEECDIVVINSEFHKNAQITLDCILTGKHIFVEKPMALTLEELDRIRGLYERSNVKLATMLGIRGTAWFQTAKRVIGSGEIGEIRLMNAQKSYRFGSRPEFMKDRETYGGTIPWVGIHAMDWLYWLSGKKFESVYAAHSARNNGDNRDLEMSALCLFHMEDEVLGSVTVDYFRPGTAPTHDDDRIRVVGTKGILEITQHKVFLLTKDGNAELEQDSEKQIFQSFIRSINGDGPCLISPQDSFYMTYVSLVARESADTGKLIRI